MFSSATKKVLFALWWHKYHFIQKHCFYLRESLMNKERRIFYKPMLIQDNFTFFNLICY